MAAGAKNKIQNTAGAKYKKENTFTRLTSRRLRRWSILCFEGKHHTFIRIFHFYFYHTFLKGITAIIHCLRALLTSYIFKGDCYHHSFLKSIASIIHFKGHCCHSSFFKIIVAVMHFWRAFLPSYIFKGHCCQHTFSNGIAAIIYFQRALLPVYIFEGHCCHNTLYYLLLVSQTTTDCHILPLTGLNTSVYTGLNAMSTALRCL